MTSREDMPTKDMPTGENPPGGAEAQATCWSCLRQHLCLACCVLVLLLAIAAIVGWSMGKPTLFQFHPDFAPMQVNTAIGFFSCALGLLLTLFKFRKAAVVATLPALILGALTMIEYASGVAIGSLDSWFVDPTITTRVSHPGRMSLYTTILFLLACSALLASGFHRSLRVANAITAISASWVIAISLLGCIGYATGVTSAQSWASLSQMSLPTVTCFLCLGSGMIIIAWRDHHEIHRRAPNWQPLIALTSSLGITLIISHVLRQQELNGIQRENRLQAAMIRNTLNAELQDRARSIRRMARRWDTTPTPDRQRWTSDGRQYLMDDRGYHYLAWVDRDLTLRWVASEHAEQKFENTPLPVTEGQREALIAQLSHNEGLILTHLDDNSSDIAVIAAIDRQDEYAGFIVAVFDSRQFFNFVFPEEIAADYLFQIRMNDRTVYRRALSQIPDNRQWVSSGEFTLHSSRWALSAWPTDKTIASQYTFYSRVLTGLGIIVSLLMGLATHLSQLATRKSREAAERNIRLQSEISERIRSQKQLQRASALNDAIVMHSAHAVISTDPSGIITSFNPAAERMLGYKAGELVGRHTPAIIHDPEEVAARSKALSVKYGEKIEAGFDVFVHEARKGIDSQVEWTYRRKDGGRFPVSLAVTAITNERGEIAGFLGVAVDISQLKNTLAELKATHDKLVEASLQVGRAEVATNILHNVGNVLNSINVSASLISDQIRNSRVSNVGRVAAMLKEQSARLPEFFESDRRGRELPEYIEGLSVRLTEEQKQVLADVAELDRHIQHVKEIVAMQQNYSKIGEMRENTPIHEIISMAMRMQAPSLSRHHIRIETDCDPSFTAMLEKHKVIQIMINLISNAKHACLAMPNEDTLISIRVSREDGQYVIVVHDNGEGIPAENMTRIFNHGFTTKEKGHGFGLHSCAIAAKEMQGSLVAESDGPGKGATFTLRFPA